MSTLVLFDFDGTITEKDSFLYFLLFSFGKVKVTVGFILLSPVLIIWKVGLLQNWKAKEWVIAYFFKKCPEQKFNQYCTDFAKNYLDKMVRRNAKQEIEKHKAQGHRIIVVSASFENYLKPWCDQNEIELIGTKIEVKDDKLTGKISGKNCYGNEKVNRVKKYLDIKEFKRILAYGDSRGDREMLQLATDRFFKYF